MIRKFLLFVGGLIGVTLLIAGPLFLVKISQFKAMGEAGAAMMAAMPPTVVTATPAKSDSWPNSLSAPGSIAAVQGVTVAAEIPGKVVRIAFEPGSVVPAGAVLVELDTTTETAQLRAAEATAALAKANLQRARELRQNNTNSLAELDAADAQAKQAEAQADSIRTVIAKKSVRAPFTGRLGLRLVNLGQILREGDAITTLQTMSPVFVNFSLPQQRVPQLQLDAVLRVKTDSAPGRTFEGRITAINPEVDSNTRSIRVQGTLENRDEALRAGMYVAVELVLPERTEVLAIPATAVLHAPYGDSIFVVEEQRDEKSGKVQQVLKQQFVRVGESRGDFVQIVDGLKPGQQVVTSGVFKLRPGTVVVIDNTLAPAAQLDPKPKNS
jgi:membrane fusion protein (multidrug efflux system)